MSMFIRVRNRLININMAKYVDIEAAGGGVATIATIVHRSRSE